MVSYTAHKAVSRDSHGIAVDMDHEGRQPPPASCSTSAFKNFFKLVFNDKFVSSYEFSQILTIWIIPGKSVCGGVHHILTGKSHEEHTVIINICHFAVIIMS